MLNLTVASRVTIIGKKQDITNKKYTFCFAVRAFLSCFSLDISALKRIIIILVFIAFEGPERGGNM